MGSPLEHTEELTAKINDYNFRVDSLLVLVWSELSRVISDKYFLDLHKNTVKDQKLTKLEEVGYVLQLICDVNIDQSAEFLNRIEELEKSKTLLEAHSKKLRERLTYADELLEQVVTENSELIEELKRKGLKEKDFSKQLRQRQLIETKDNTIQRLQVALESARRDLDNIYNSRPNTPSLSEELQQENPSIVVSQPERNSEDLLEQSELSRVENKKILSGLLEKTKNILSNARKTGSRGYTAETKSRKLAELENCKVIFENIDRNNISDEEIVTEFRTTLEAAKTIVQNLPTTPRDRTNSDQIPLQIVGNTRSMATFSEILKDVSRMVPIFYGADGPDLSTEANKFIQGCMLVKDNFEVAGNTRDILKCIKTRLFGKAFEYLQDRDFETVEALCQTVKDKFIRTRTMSEIQELISSSRQNSTESAYEFGERVEGLLREAINLIKLQWQDAAHQKSMTDYCNQEAVRSFIRGLRDPKLVARFIGHENATLASLLQSTREAQRLLGNHMRLSHVMTLEAEDPQHATMERIIKEMQQLNANQNVLQQQLLNHGGQYNFKNFSKRCNFCNKPGHLLNECFKRNGQVNQGTRYQRREAGKPIESRHTQYPNTQQYSNSTRTRTNQNINEHKNRNCYTCGQQGHFSANCPANRNNRNMNNNNGSGRNGFFVNRRSPGNEGRPDQK